MNTLPNRRQALASLAALPLVGAPVAARPTPTPHKPQNGTLHVPRCGTVLSKDVEIESPPSIIVPTFYNPKTGLTHFMGKPVFSPVSINFYSAADRDEVIEFDPRGFPLPITFLFDTHHGTIFNRIAVAGQPLPQKGTDLTVLPSVFMCVLRPSVRPEEDFRNFPPEELCGRALENHLDDIRQALEKIRIYSKDGLATHVNSIQAQMDEIKKEFDL